MHENPVQKIIGSSISMQARVGGHRVRDRSAWSDCSSGDSKVPFIRLEPDGKLSS